MDPQVNGITLGVTDVNQAKRFYGEGLGWPIQQEQGEWVSFAINNGSCVLGLLPRDALASDAGVAAEGSGYRGVMFSTFVPNEERVDAVLAEADGAGGTIVKPGQAAQWGGYFGYFADPDGHLWKVVVGPGE
jgi:uncharacterized protein